MAQQGQQAAGGAVGDQFYVTHCTTADSVLNNPGYTVRAASATDPDALDAAFRYPPYELPIDMWRDLPQVPATPRRLARTEHPDGGVWAVHSAYLAKDTVGRDRSYFSHLLLLPSADPATVLRSWGSDGWTIGYPVGATKALPGGARLPVGPLVNDAALTAFLGDSPPGPTDLNVAVCPPRMRASAADRRDLFARVLQALVLLAEEDDESRRMYVHAEPGVIALLLYGAVRLLPPGATENLTFTTYEPYHRNFRDFKLARVVGTYLGSAEKGLEPDLGNVRGIALDTFVPARSSLALRKPLNEVLPTGVSELIDLAHRGEWKLLPQVRNTIGADVSGLARAPKALARARGLARVDAGEANIDELLAVQEDRIAAEELKARKDKVWPVVKAAALDARRADVRTAFRDLLADPERVKELWEEAFDAILREDFRTWDERWTVVREVAPGEAKKLLAKLLGSEKNEGKLSKLPTDVRARLRAACAEVGALPPRPLLVPIGLGELEPLLAAPPDWAGYTAFVLMARDELNWLPHIPPPNRGQMRKRVREFLQSAPPPALAAYVHAARPYLDTDPAFLAALFAPYSPGAARLMDKLLVSTTLEPGDWMKLVESVGLNQNEWGEYLLEKDHLASLLVGLGGDGIGRGVWQGYLDSLTPGLVSPDLIEVGEGVEPVVVHEWERKVHAHLKTAAERLTAAGVKLAPALPDGGVARLFAANNLLKWVKDPFTAERDGSEEVKHACAAFGLEPFRLVEVAYKQGGYAHHDPGAEPQEFAPLLALFKTCFPVDHVFNTAGRAVREAIKLSRFVPAKSRGALQVRILHTCVWDGHYRALLTADWKEPLHPDALAWLSECVNRPTKKAGSAAPKAAGPNPMAALEPEAVAEVASVGDGELPTPDTMSTGKGAKATKTTKKGAPKKAASGGYKASRRQSGGNMWLYIGSGLLVLVAVIAVGYFFMRKKETPPPEPVPETKTEPKKADSPKKPDTPKPEKEKPKP